MFRKVVLTAVAIVAFTVASTQAAINEDIVKATIVKHSMEMGVDPALALSIAKKESGFKHELKSSHGAVGVFQLLPSTANRMGYNPYYLSENIKAGLTYYKMMYKMFGSTELALAAYNAGPVAVSRTKSIPSVSQKFVKDIMADYNNYKKNPDQSIIQASKKAPRANNMFFKPQHNLKPVVRTSPCAGSDGKAGLSQHSVKMIDRKAVKEVSDSLI